MLHLTDWVIYYDALLRVENQENQVYPLSKLFNFTNSHCLGNEKKLRIRIRPLQRTFYSITTFFANHSQGKSSC